MDPLGPSELAAFRRGDQELFRRIVEAVTPRLLRIVRPFVRDVGEAHDLVQETWQRAFLRRSDYRGEGSLVGWLLAIARNVARRQLRRASPPQREEEAAAVAGDPEAELEQLELQRALVAAVADLPERERETLVLRLVLGCSTRETAERLGCAEGTVKAALAHALAKLKPALKEWKR